MEGRKRKREMNMYVAPTGKAKVDWSGVGTVAGSTLQGLGTGLLATTTGTGSSSTAPAIADNTPILVLGGVLLVGVIVFAMGKK